MKIIDLLNKIANGEKVPKKIKYNGLEYIWCNGDKDYYNDFECLIGDLIGGYHTDVALNCEIEIIEDNKIEKLNLDTDELLKNVIITAQDYVIEGKINEIIDKINEMSDK